LAPVWFICQQNWAGARHGNDNVQSTSMKPTPSDATDTSKRALREGLVFQDVARFRGLLFDALLRPYNLTMSQAWIIFHLLRENGLAQADLAARLDVATVTVSKLIDRLETHDLVIRCADPADRRIKRIYITDKAKSLSQNMTKAQQQLHDLAKAGIDPAALDTTLQVLAQMRQNLKTALDDHRPDQPKGST
jgi:MarR family transcriptional regulator for hemolysin